MAFREEISSKPLLQFLLIAVLCVASATIFSVIGVALSLIFYDFDIHNLVDYSAINSKSIDGLKFMQLFSAIGLFIVPPILYALLTAKNALKKLNLNQFSRPANYILVFLLLFVATPFLAWLVEFNAQLVLPDFLSGLENWMKSSEDKAMELTKAFLTFDGVGSLVYMLIVVAVIPSLGEELLFRGILQKIIISWTKKPHLGIWITAILFSALHLQFYGFLPRMLLGVFFGYLFYWSRSLWIPILGHFINNGSVVIVSYFYPEKMDETEITFFADTTPEMLLILASLVLTIGVIFLFKKMNPTKKPPQQATSSVNDEDIADHLILPRS